MNIASRRTRQRGYGIGGIHSNFYRSYTVNPEKEDAAKISNDLEQQLHYQKQFEEFCNSVRNIEVPDNWEECEWPDETDTYQEKRQKRRRRRKERVCPYTPR